MAWVGRSQASGYLLADSAIMRYLTMIVVSGYAVEVSTVWSLGLGEAEADFREIAQIKLTGGLSECFGSHIIIRKLLRALRSRQKAWHHPHGHAGF